MTDAPERIWANVTVWSFGQALAGEWNHCDVNSHDDTEYIRSDIPHPQDAERITKLEAENAHLRATISALIKNSEVHFATTRAELGQIKISINQAERSVACLNNINERSQKRISDLEAKNELLLAYYRAGEDIAAIEHEWRSRKAKGELLDGPNIFNLTDKLTSAEARLFVARAALVSALGDVK